jgi:hypothetical protein
MDSSLSLRAIPDDAGNWEFDRPQRPAIRDLQIEPTPWPLKVAGRMEIPAATAFERLIWQDRRVAEVT